MGQQPLQHSIMPLPVCSRSIPKAGLEAQCGQQERAPSLGRDVGFDGQELPAQGCVEELEVGSWVQDPGVGL